MKEFILCLNFLTLILLHPFSGLVSQPAFKIYGDRAENNVISSQILSKADSLALIRLPVLKPVTGLLKSTTLPVVVDNSTQPYFRPLFEQVASECGQYASIGFTFTYEYNYLHNSPANIPENQFPTHYTYNFMNGGFGWHGVSYFHSFEIARANGHPTVVDFGSNNTCGPSFWMSGYDNYYRGMSNKIEEVYQIPVSDEAGLLVLKNWLHNHLNGEEVGGIACFYSATPWNLDLLPEESPEAGKKVMTTFKHPATHSSAITGYHDSIRYDYNQDGLFTNHIDINGDGLVNMQDWEIGGLRFTDSYIDGVNWADSGFCYMMYKTLADNVGEGGIWNHAVHVVKVKEDYEPQLTMKVKVRHSCRKALKLMAGVSNEAGSLFPEYTMGFPLFDFQGACQFMQGGWDPGMDTLELGLDITPLLGRIQSNEEALFFLMVYEDDPESQGAGEILAFSLLDYNNGGIEINHPQFNVPIENNNLTLLAIPVSLNFNAMAIDTESLPLAYTGEQYEHQMMVEGGTPPYSWSLIQAYEELNITKPYPVLPATELIFPDTMHSQVMQELGFSFPFYGEAYDSIWIHTDGFIMFDDQPFPWPYLYDEHLMIRKSKIIAPFLDNFLYISAGNESGVWFESSSDEVRITWRVNSKFPAGSFYDFTLELFPDGQILFYYDFEPEFSLHTWASGISCGDDKNFQFASISGFQATSGNLPVIFTPLPFPDELGLSETGLFSGTPLQNYPGVDLLFDVTDAAGLNQRKSLKFYSYVAGFNETENTWIGEVALWPNPATNHINLEFYLKQVQRIEFELLDVSGKKISVSEPAYYRAGLNKLAFDLHQISEISEGLYYLVFKREQEIIHAEKIILSP